MTRPCPRCGEEIMASEQRFCHACGAMLSAGTPTPAANGVGDGSDHALTAYVRQTALHWLSAHRGRVALYAGGVALAVAVVAAAVVTLVVALVAAVAALAPVALVVVFILLAAGPRRRRRRHHRHWVRFDRYYRF